MGNFGPGHLRQDVNEESVTAAPERQQNSSDKDDDDCPLAELAKKKKLKKKVLEWNIKFLLNRWKCD